MYAVLNQCESIYDYNIRVKFVLKTRSSNLYTCHSSAMSMSSGTSFSSIGSPCSGPNWVRAGISLLACTQRTFLLGFSPLSSSAISFSTSLSGAGRLSWAKDLDRSSDEAGTKLVWSFSAAAAAAASTAALLRS